MNKELLNETIAGFERNGIPSMIGFDVIYQAAKAYQAQVEVMEIIVSRINDAIAVQEAGYRNKTELQMALEAYESMKGE